MTDRHTDLLAVADRKVSDKAFTQIMGNVVRKAREDLGWTRADLVKLLPSGIGERTLLAYEHGTRHLTVERLEEIALAFGLAGSVLLARAERQALDLRNLPIRVVLHDVLADNSEEFHPVQVWAKNLLSDDTAEMLLYPATIRNLAASMSLDHSALAGYLFEFSTADHEPNTLDA